MRIYGLILNYDNDLRKLTIKTKYKLLYLYLKKSIHHKFKLFLNKDVLIDVEVIKNKNELNVCYFNKIISLNPYKVTYDTLEIDKSLANVLANIDYFLFLDIENTMPPYGHKGSFNSEIIQLAYILKDKNLKEVARFNSFIKPKSDSSLTDRTCKFLNIKINHFYKEAISPKRLYYHLIGILKKYHPAIIIYGKNDSISLRNFVLDNKLKPINNLLRFINLSSLIMNYYHHSKEEGLFNLYKYYSHNELVQVHDAFTDTMITAAVFKYFRDDVLNNKFSI